MVVEALSIAFTFCLALASYMLFLLYSYVPFVIAAAIASILILGFAYYHQLHQLVFGEKALDDVSKAFSHKDAELLDAIMQSKVSQKPKGGSAPPSTIKKSNRGSISRVEVAIAVDSLLNSPIQAVTKNRPEPTPEENANGQKYRTVSPVPQGGQQRSPVAQHSPTRTSSLKKGNEPVLLHRRPTRAVWTTDHERCVKETSRPLVDDAEAVVEEGKVVESRPERHNSHSLPRRRQTRAVWN